METSESLRTGRLSVVLPAYNEVAADVIGNLLTRAGIDHELIFVNDGSRDHTWRAIQEAAARRPQVRGIRFSRNFGKEAAIFAGLAQARGDCCVVLDCDLQHPPEKILEMYSLWQQGWQVVEGIKVSRGKESPLHTLAAKTFYRFLSGATRLDMSHASDFNSSCWTGGRWTCWWPCGRRTPSSGPCPPGSALTPPRWNSRCSPGPPDSPSGPCAASPGTPSPTSGAGLLVPVAEDQRAGPGGLYHRHPAPAPHRQRIDGLPGHFGVLYRQDLRGDQGPAPVHRRGRLRRKRRL